MKRIIKEINCNLQQEIGTMKFRIVLLIMISRKEAKPGVSPVEI
jgi:hypothetical protein